MADRCAIGGNAASYPDVHAEPRVPLLVAFNVDDLVTVENSHAGGFAHCPDERTQFGLRDRPQIHTRNRVKAEFQRLKRQTVLLCLRQPFQIPEHHQGFDQTKGSPVIESSPTRHISELELGFFGGKSVQHAKSLGEGLYRTFGIIDPQLARADRGIFRPWCHFRLRPNSDNEHQFAVSSESE